MSREMSPMGAELFALANALNEAHVRAFGFCITCGIAVPRSLMSEQRGRCVEHVDADSAVRGCAECGGESASTGGLVRHSRDCEGVL